MKRICIIVLVVLASIMRVNAQVAKDTIVSVQDATTEVVSQQNNNKVTNQEKIQDEKPKKNWWQRLWSKSDDSNDCKQCESQLAQANKDVKSLEKQVGDLNKKLGNAKALLDIDDGDFYRGLIKTPLTRKYDSIQVDYYKKTVALFDHENKKEMKRVYKFYYPLLENYGKYSEDLAKLIRKVIRRFELPDDRNSETEKVYFNEGLEEMEYFKKYRHKNDGLSQEIKYLEDVIEKTDSLFDNPLKFKKENFEEQLRRLEK